MVNNIFINNLKKIIKKAKILIKDYKYFIIIQFINFNKIQLKFNLNSIILIKKSYINNIFLIIGYNIDFINIKNIIKNKLLLKK